MKCLEGNTYRIKHAKNWRKRLLRHRDQLCVLHTRPERLQPTHGENLTGPPTVVPSTVSPALSVSMPPPSSQVKDNANPEDAASALHQSGQLEDSVTREDTPSRDTQTRALLCPLTDIAAPSVPTAQGSVPNLCRPPQGLGTEPFG